MKDPIIKIPVSTVYCCQCKTEYSAKQLSYIPVAGKIGMYKAPYCPHCAKEISLERLKIDGKYIEEALTKSARMFMSSGRDPSANYIKFITIFYQGGVSGCACIWPRYMSGVERAVRLDKYISKVFDLKSYSRSVIPQEYPPTGVPFKYVYVQISKEAKRTPIADFRLN